MGIDVEREQRARLAALKRLEELEAVYGDVLPAAALRHGFFFEGAWVSLTAQQGIWRPRNPVRLELPISIRTAASDPYGDEMTDAGLSYAYRWRGLTEEQAQRHADNVGLREAMAAEVPLVYFHEVGSREYQALWPAWIVGDDPAAMRFRVAVGDHDVGELATVLALPESGELRYATRVAKVRLHQRHFAHLVVAGPTHGGALS